MEFVSTDTLSRFTEPPSDASSPDLEEVLASKKDGLPVPRYAGKTIHSLVDPKEEARRFVDISCQRAGVRAGEKVVLLGNGFGYAAEALLERGVAPVVFEPCRTLFRGMRRHRDAAALARSAELFLIDDPADLYRSGRHREALEGAKAVFTLPYVSWLSPSFAARFEKKARAIREAAGAYYRVSVVSPLYGGSWEIARYAVNGLRGIGLPVDFVDVSPFGAVPAGLRRFHARTGPAPLARSEETFAAWSSDRIMERVERFDPGIVLVLAQAPLLPDHVKEMRARGRRVVFWFVEDFHLFRYWEQYAGLYDVFLPIQKGEFLRDIEAAGQSNAHYLPLAADDTIFHPQTLSPEDEKRFASPLSFMGAGYYNRRRFFNVLLSRPFKIWGSDWPQGEPLSRLVQEGGRRVSAEETAKIFNGTSVNVNLHSSTSHDGVNPFGDFVNPRTFEIAACGAFQLVDRRSLLPELFAPGEETACFAGREDFLDRIDHYLSHPGEREAMAARAMARVLGEHTYRDRMREMVEVIHELCPPEGGRRLPTVAEMASGDAGKQWGKLLSGFRRDRPLDFDTLHADIGRKNPKDAIAKKEAVVLLLGRLRDGRF